MEMILTILFVEKQSYSATVWTGLLSLPDEYVGKAIKLNISSAQDMRGNIMRSEIFLKHQKKLYPKQEEV